MKDTSIEQFLNNKWDTQHPTSEWYICIDVVYPECTVQQLLFNEEGYDNFSKSLQKPNSEIKRIVWRYQKK